jgi:hypothetical protein
LEFVVDWSQWSQDAVAAVGELNDRWVNEFQLQGAKYFWNVDEGRITFHVGERAVEARICVVGSAVDDVFRWGWADESMPVSVTRELDRLRAFGDDNDLPLLTTPEIAGGSAQGKECVAIAARVLGSDGVFIDQDGDVTIFFALSEFKAVRSGVVG